MEIARKIARLIFPHYRFGETRIDDAIKLVKLGVGGFCLYGGSVDEVIETVRILRSESDHPLLFAADYENGVGQWVSGATKLPPNMAIAATRDSSLARRKAEITAIESDALGVDWVFAPVVDLADNHSNPIVNIRAFSDDISTTIAFAKDYISGLNSFNIINSIKHFPGHGSTSVDSHLVLPEINKTFDEIYNYDMQPFRYLCDVADSVMVGHIMITSVDKNPASLSKKFISDILKEKMNFKGVVITDALMMKAINNDTDAGVMAFMAGADFLLYPTDSYRLYENLLRAYSKGDISEAMIDFSLKRIEKLISKRMLSNYRIKDISVVGSKEHKEFVSDIAPKAISWAKEYIAGKEKIFYLEIPQINGEFKGEIFVDELKKCGFEISNLIDNANTVIVGIFSSPKAFSGSINLGEKEKKMIDEIISKNKKVIGVSFGSPFVFDGYLDKFDGALCCFCDLPDFQKVAAKAVSGEIKVYGKLPVRIL